MRALGRKGAALIAATVIAILAICAFSSSSAQPLSKIEREILTAADISPGNTPYSYKIEHIAANNPSYANRTDAAWCQFDNQTLSVQVELMLFNSSSDSRKALASLFAENEGGADIVSIQVVDGGFLVQIGANCEIAFTANGTLVEIYLQYIGGFNDHNIGIEATHLAALQAAKVT